MKSTGGSKSKHFCGKKQQGAEANLQKNRCPSVCLWSLVSGRPPALDVNFCNSVFSSLPPNSYLYPCHPHFVFPFLSIFLPFPFLLPTPPRPTYPQKNEGDLFHRLWHVMNEILDLRRQVLVGHLTHDRMRDVKQHITARLDWGNE